MLGSQQVWPLAQARSCQLAVGRPPGCWSPLPWLLGASRWAGPTALNQEAGADADRYVLLARHSALGHTENIDDRPPREHGCGQVLPGTCVELTC